MDQRVGRRVLHGLFEAIGLQDVAAQYRLSAAGTLSSPTTAHPSVRSRRTNAWPMKPELPVTRIFMLMSLSRPKGRSLDRLAWLIYQIDLSIANST